MAYPKDGSDSSGQIVYPVEHMRETATCVMLQNGS